MAGVSETVNLVKTGIHARLFICRDDGRPMDPELHAAIMRKFQALVKRFGCTAHGWFRPGRPPGHEDTFGMAEPPLELDDVLPLDPDA